MTASEANQRLTADLKLVMRDAEDLLKATAGDTGEKVKEVRRRLATALESAKATCEAVQKRAIETAKATYERLQDKAVESAKATDQTIREHPYESIGTALGVGLLIGVLLGRH